MTIDTPSQQGSRHPSSQSERAISVHALSCGHFTLPEYQFVHPVSADARKTVPSLAFLIQHTNGETGCTTRIVFDLGLRRHIERYAPQIQKHVQTRQPMVTVPDVVQSLAMGGLLPNDINYILYSHVHWDHIGEPRDFPVSTFLVGNGTLNLINGTSPALRGGHSYFERDLLPQDRTIELSHPTSTFSPLQSKYTKGIALNQAWKPYKNLPETLDIFNDGTVLIVNAPGHLAGHLNVLVQLSDTHSVYLGGDACHDRRLLSGEKEVGEWRDADGHICCIHADRKRAEETIGRIRDLENAGVEVIFAHDVNWENAPENQHRFFGAAKAKGT